MFICSASNFVSGPVVLGIHLARDKVAGGPLLTKLLILSSRRFLVCILLMLLCKLLMQTLVCLTLF